MRNVKRTGAVFAILMMSLLPLQAVDAGGGNGDRAFTAWAFVFNNPGACVDGCGADDLGRAGVDGAVIYLTGQRVQSNGRAILAGAISANSAHRQIGGNSPLGLLLPLTAEIHVGLQDHQQGSLDGDDVSRHAEVTQPCGPPCALVQAAIFLPGDSVGTVVPFGGGAPIPGAAATMTREATGVSISIDTRL